MACFYVLFINFHYKVIVVMGRSPCSWRGADRNMLNTSTNKKDSNGIHMRCSTIHADYDCAYYHPLHYKNINLNKDSLHTLSKYNKCWNIRLYSYARMYFRSAISMNERINEYMERVGAHNTSHTIATELFSITYFMPYPSEWGGLGWTGGRQTIAISFCVHTFIFGERTIYKICTFMHSTPTKVLLNREYWGFINKIIIKKYFCINISELYKIFCSLISF